ncbi:hypothetical protein [Faecalibaculum rodentium]|jgi:hypothetical protein|uniref:hypothetical protein n=1 Tax=Faecalibaculum rodentium TaxID=1702221 RepID=UPI001F57925E|nr:hypothetical protein [Faecalibaculum rodentium]
MATSSFGASFSVTNADDAAKLREMLNRPVTITYGRKTPTINREKEAQTIERLKGCLRKVQ